jgi:hypothetical protein
MEWGGQKVLSRPSAESFAVGRRQKQFVSYFPDSQLMQLCEINTPKKPIFAISFPLFIYGIIFSFLLYWSFCVEAYFTLGSWQKRFKLGLTNQSINCSIKRATSCFNVVPTLHLMSCRLYIFFSKKSERHTFHARLYIWYTGWALFPPSFESSFIYGSNFGLGLWEQGCRVLVIILGLFA